MKPEKQVVEAAVPVLGAEEIDPQPDGRRTIRLVCNLPILCDIGHRKMEATIIDLSWGGVRVLSRREVPPGSLVRLIPLAAVHGYPTSPAWAVCRWSRSLEQGRAFLSGHQFQSGAAAPSRLWVMQRLTNLGQTPTCLSERRKTRRYRLQVSAIIVEDPSIPCKVWDFGQGGACVETEQPIDGPSLRVALPLAGRQMILRGDIVDSRPLPTGGVCHHISWESYIPERAAVGILLSTLKQPEESA